MRFDASVADHGERVARRAAFGVVVDDDVGRHSVDSAWWLAPSARPISLSFRSMAISSMLSCGRSEEHTSELQSLMRISYAVFCLQNKTISHHYFAYKHKHT